MTNNMGGNGQKYRQIGRTLCCLKDFVMLGTKNVDIIDVYNKLNQDILTTVIRSDKNCCIKLSRTHFCSSNMAATSGSSLPG